eukprot:TRINITY_DN1299_c1_g1_i2.p2 TRINITY_DN1299_c1_g1~~TRINITY_DN1299_c1_g1_i2.p2  ORF type:complete len:200 (-),score=82.64 TRINITY_DN1299_c1_g1_i2:71-670(-)
MGNNASALDSGVKACVGSAPEAELKELLGKLDSKDYERLRSTLLDLQTPRDAPAPAAAAAEAAGEAKADPIPEEAPAAEAAATEEAPAPAAPPAEEKAAEAEAPAAAEEKAAPAAEELKAADYGLTEEQFENIQKAFKAIDKDKSESIELDELKIVCKAMHLSTEENDVKTLLEQMDKNGDGKIQLQEYVAMVAKTLKK